MRGAAAPRVFELELLVSGLCVCVHAHRILLLTEELASNSSAGGGSPTSFSTRITCSRVIVFYNDKEQHHLQSDGEGKRYKQVC